VIIQAGISEIIYLSDKYKDTDQVKASKIMLDTSPHISYRQLKTKLDSIIVSFVPPEL
jgi:dCMP deaminase